MNVFVALLSALVVLPPMLVWADQRNWVSRGLVPREILDGSVPGVGESGLTPVGSRAVRAERPSAEPA